MHHTRHSFYGSRGIIIPLVAALLGLGLWSGCDSLLSSMDSESGSATFNVLLTDAPFPFDLVKEANVTITEVQLVPTSSDEEEEDADDNGIVTLKSSWEIEGETRDSISYNLLELQNGVTAQLVGDAEIPAGTYGQVRLIVAREASVVDTNETVYDLKIPSGTQTGVKIQLNDLEVNESSETTLTLDFNVEDSFVLRGSFNGLADINGMIFKPVVHLQSITDGAPEDADEETEEETEASGEAEVSGENT